MSIEIFTEKSFSTTTIKTMSTKFRVVRTNSITHFESFDRGVIDSKDAVFYITVIFVGLFFTARSLESLRWRS